MIPAPQEETSFDALTQQVKATLTVAMEGDKDARERAGRILVSLARGSARELAVATQAVIAVLYSVALTLADRVKALLERNFESAAFAGSVVIDPGAPPRLALDLGGKTSYALPAEDLDVRTLRRGDIVGLLPDGTVYRKVSERPRVTRVARVDLVLDHGEVVASDVDAGGNRFVLQRAECVQGVPREGDQVFHAFGFYYGSREGRETCTTPRFKVDLTPGLPCGRWWPATTAWWPRSRRS